MVDISKSYYLIQTDMDGGIEGNQLLWGGKTTPLAFTYSFLNSIPDYYGNASYEINITNNFSADTFSSLSQEQQEVVNSILQSTPDNSYRLSFSDVVGHLSFSKIEVTGNSISESGDITFGKATRVSESVDLAVEFSVKDAADNFLDSISGSTADKSGVIFNAATFSGFLQGQLGYETILHEISHSLGLGHSSDVLTGANSYLDSQKYTVMSYNPHDSVFAGTLQILDIAALQNKYGFRNYDVRGEDTTYGLDKGIGLSVDGVYDGGSFMYTIWDGNGIDTIDATGFSRNSLTEASAEIDLRQGRFSSFGLMATGEEVNKDADASASDPDPGNVAIAFHTVIENAVGTDLNDTLIGNAWSNVLDGRDGNDNLYGGGVEYDGDIGFVAIDKKDPNDPNRTRPVSDDDVLIGGKGNDHLYGGSGFDTADYSTDASMGGLHGINVTQNGDGSLKVVDGFGGADDLHSIERIVGTQFNDSVDFSGGILPLAYSMDGKGGEDTFTGKLSGFYDETTKSYYEGGGVVKLENFEKIEGTVILADVHNARTLEGRVLTSEQDTDGPHYSFKASDVGAVVNLTVDAGYTETLENGHYSYHIIRNIEASYNFGGSVWNGNILDLDTTFVSSAYSHASNFWQVVSGTNKGDTFNVNMDTSNQDGLVTRLAIETGTGNDTINFSQGNYSSFALGYTGGNDVVHNAGALVNIYLEGFSSENVSVTGIAISGGYVTGYKILFDAGNSITLDGLHIDATGGTILNFPISGLSVTTAGAITTGAAVIDGAYIGHEPTFYGKSVWNGGESGETYFAGAGNNTVSGNGGDDNLYGQQGNDTLDGGSGNNILSGGAGDDTLKSFQGVSRLYGGDGSDTYIISSSSTSYIDDRDPDNVDWHSQNGSNTLVIKNLNFDELDFVIGAGGTLNIIDDKGVSFANLADYRHFSSFKFGEGNVSISLNDLLDRTAENVEKLYCTQEVDSIIAPFRTDGVTSKYSLGGGDDEFTGSSGREIVLGESGDDHISGEGGNDNLLGGDGNDRLLGGVGDDELYGSSGEDYLQGGQGNDVINGGDDVDLVGYLDFENLSGVGVNVDLAAGLASNDGYGTVDTLIGIENVQGSRYDDVLSGTDEANSLWGETGNDILEGRGGDDVLVGGLGNDTYIFNPGDGEDTIVDSGGEDTLRIGGGITYDDLTFTQDGNNLYIHIASGVTIRNQFGSSPNAVIEWAEFDDGTKVRLPNPFEVVNRAPVAATDSFTLNEDTVFSGNVLLNDSDPDGDALLVTAATFVTTSGATVALLEDGTFTYSPAANVNGVDSFTYTVSDGHGHETSALVNLTVLAVNDNPVAANDLYAASASSVSGNVLLNDTDIDGDVLSVANAGDFHTAAGGLVSLAANGQFVYSAALGYVGNDQFTYTVADGQGGTSQANVSLTLNAQAGSTMDTQGYDFLVGDKGPSTLYGLGGDDYMIGRDGADKLFGGVGKDTLVGNNGNDLLVGGTGSDTLFGGVGNDTLIGGDVIVVTHSDGSLGYVSTRADTSDDILIGGSGDDLLIAAGGRDLLYGDGGTDTFMFLEADGKTDQIFGFNSRQGDKIDLSALLEDYDPITDAIADFVRVTSSKGQTTISVDTDGGGNNYVDIVSLNGVAHDDLNSMISKGNLVV